MLHVYLCRTRLVHSLLDRMSGAVSIPNRMASVGECEALRKHDRVDLPFEVIPAYANGTKSKSTQENRKPTSICLFLYLSFYSCSETVKSEDDERCETATDDTDRGG